MENTNDFENRTNLDQLKNKVEELKQRMGEHIIGQQDMVHQMIVALLADGHILLEGVPGVAKTLAAKTLSHLISAKYSRIQFTPDLMPSDVLGTSVFNLKSNEFEFKKGPIFTEVALIDEINRAPAKTQAALFEVMEERQVSIDGKTYKMGDLFFTLATQNPIEQEGTYRLPEAQLDRFLFKIVVQYPNLEEEVDILKLHHSGIGSKTLPESLISLSELQELRAVVSKIVVQDNLLDYIAQIVQKTRVSPDIFLGASPRAAIAILTAAKSTAAIAGRDFVLPEDIQYVAPPALRHRMILSPEKEMEGMSTDEVINSIIGQIDVPR